MHSQSLLLIKRHHFFRMFISMASKSFAPPKSDCRDGPSNFALLLLHCNFAKANLLNLSAVAKDRTTRSRFTLIIKQAHYSPCYKTNSLIPLAINFQNTLQYCIIKPNVLIKCLNLKENSPSGLVFIRASPEKNGIGLSQ